MCVDTDYFETYNRPNVRLVSIRETPIDEITETGLRVGDEEFAFDTIVLGTGFDAMTGALLGDRPARPRRPVAAREVGGRAALGARPDDRGLPEPLHRDRPRQPLRAQQHDGLDRAARRLDRRLHRVPARARHRHDRAARAAEEDAWVEHVRAVGDASLYPRAKSWYMGANIPGKPRVLLPYVGGVGAYRALCDARRRARLRGLRPALTTRFAPPRTLELSMRKALFLGIGEPG